MQKSLIQDLKAADVQAVLNSLNLNDYYYPTLFPAKQVNSLYWSTVEATTGAHIAGDFVARGNSVAIKSREALTKLTGDIPKVAYKRIKEEDELLEYQTMLAMTQGNADKQRLIEAWADDVKAAWDGVASRLEWAALQSISLGKMQLTKLNNIGPVSEYNLDYQLGNRLRGYGTGSTTWANAATAKPITVDLRTAIAAARAEGFNPKFAFMSMATFAEFAACEEVVKLCSSYLINAVNGAYMPDIDSVNTTLKKIAYLYGLQIVVIDQSITLEMSDGSRTTTNPFADGVVLLSESKVLGNTFWTRPVDMSLQGSPAICVMNGHICTKKYSLVEDAPTEVTLGIANAIPAWSSSQRSMLIDVHNSSWSH